MPHLHFGSSVASNVLQGSNKNSFWFILIRLIIKGGNRFEIIAPPPLTQRRTSPPFAKNSVPNTFFFKSHWLTERSLLPHLHTSWAHGQQSNCTALMFRFTWRLIVVSKLIFFSVLSPLFLTSCLLYLLRCTNKRPYDRYMHSQRAAINQAFGYKCKVCLARQLLDI